LNSQYARALLRFWWVAVIGALCAVALAIFAVNRVSLGIPPKLSPRKPPIYVATSQLFVDGPSSPYLRTAVTETLPQSSSAGHPQAAPTQTVSSPDTSVLLSAANLYPVIIQSDQVTALRQQVYGEVDGSVVARAAFASASPYGSYKLSPIPIIDVTAYSLTSANALKLARDTVAAFHLWLADKQSSSKIPASERVIVRELQAPTSTSRIDNSSFTLPAGVAILVLGLTFGLIVLLDRWRERRDAGWAGSEQSAGGAPAGPEPAVAYAQGAAPTSSPAPSASGADF
jgi:hypothetical protein